MSTAGTGSIYRCAPDYDEDRDREEVGGQETMDRKRRTVGSSVLRSPIGERAQFDIALRNEGHVFVVVLIGDEV